MRVAVVIHRREEALGLARWAWRLARALEGELVVLWVLERAAAETRVLRHGDDLAGVPAAAVELLASLPDPAAEAAGDDGGDTEPAEAGGTERPLAHPPVDLVWPAGSDDLAAVLTALEERPADLLLVAPPRERGPRLSLARRLFAAAPCHTVLLRPGAAAGAACRGVLVPTAGGPSAHQALILAHRLARAEGAVMDALYVEPAAVEAGEEVGRSLLDRALARAGVADDESVRPQVVLADDLAGAIEAAIAPHHDLVLLGASHASGLRSLLFGTVPERLLKAPSGVAVGVVREAWSWSDRLRARLGRWLDLRIPQLDRDHRIELYERLQTGSQWSFDFMLLIALSTAIAALGLVQNSAAVVIGAMLVAPLMTPILGLGLALLQGNLPLVRGATRSILSGYLLALALGVVVGWLAAPALPTAELQARGGPTLLDMGVAFLSGIAAAYCLGRPGLMAALPGVAIAAALVPPIATTGVALARADWALAQGASLLFGTNVVAIVLGAALSLYAIGVRARREATRGQRWTRLLLALLLVALLLLAVPLAERWRQSRSTVSIHPVHPPAPQSQYEGER